MKIAILGTRGVPASYSGFETCVEQLGQRLVQRGHEVTVYCRSHHIKYPDDVYKGMRLIKIPTVRNKYLDTLVHSFICSLHAMFQDYDVALYFIAGNSLVTWIPRVVGIKTALNVDGLDWKRDKWPKLAKYYIQFAEYMATKVPTKFLTDSRVVQSYYSDRFGKKPLYIPYGSDVQLMDTLITLEQFNLEPNKYILFVGRLVRENCVHHLIQAFKDINTDIKCVIVGDAAYEDRYISSLKELASGNQNIIFTGYIFGNGYYELGSNSYLFVETSGVGGTHPALIEAMAFGNCVVVHNTPENLEVIGDAGFAYEGSIGAKSLTVILQKLVDSPEIVNDYRKRAKNRATALYNWESVTDLYEQMFNGLMN